MMGPESDLSRAQSLATDHTKRLTKQYFMTSLTEHHENVGTRNILEMTTVLYFHHHLTFIIPMT